MHTLFRRYALSAAVAALVTGTLVLIMHYAIHTEEAEYVEYVPVSLPPANPQLDDVPVDPRDPLPPKPEPPVLPPEVQLPDFALVDTGGDHPSFTPPPKEMGVTPNPSVVEGEMLPILTVPPEYPRRMLSRGTEGWVIVEFTVDELGRVTTPRVVASFPSNGFDQSALKAVLRYKYKPRVVNGTAVPVQGVRQRIVFSLGQA